MFDCGVRTPGLGGFLPSHSGCLQLKLCVLSYKMAGVLPVSGSNSSGEGIPMMASGILGQTESLLPISRLYTSAKGGVPSEGLPGNHLRSVRTKQKVSCLSQTSSLLVPALSR